MNIPTNTGEIIGSSFYIGRSKITNIMMKIIGSSFLMYLDKNNLQGKAMP